MNVLWIVVDCLRHDALTINGYSRATTAPIDGCLASDFVAFDDACTQSGFTLNVLSSMVTGTYPSTHGVLRWSDTFPEDLPNYADVSNDAGLAPPTAVPGMNFVSEEWGLDRAFSDVHGLEEAKADRECSQARADEIVDEAKAAIEGGQPFNAMLWFFDLHEPRLSEPRYDGRNPHRDGYDTELRFVAEQLDELFAWLEQEGLYDDTLIMLTGDHGDIFDEHQNLPWNRWTGLAERVPGVRRLLYGGGYVGHIGRPFVEELVHVPLFVKLPSAEKGGTHVEGQVELIDLLPTVLDAADGRVSEEIEGESLLPRIRGQRSGKEYVRAEMGPEPATGLTRMVRDDGQTYIRHDQPSIDAIEDLPRDVLIYAGKRFFTPEEVLLDREDESTNVVDERPEVADRMRTVMDRWEGGAGGEGAGISEERREELEQLGYL